MASTPKENVPTEEWIALLGRQDMPTDGVEDYCDFLGKALERRGIELKKRRVGWAERGWLAALRELLRESRTWRGKWVLLQYTALAWSRWGLPVGALAAAWILRRRGAFHAVVFHEPSGHPGRGWRGAVRASCQGWILRALYRGSVRSIFTIPLSDVDWVYGGSGKAVYVPIGANIPEFARAVARDNTHNGTVKTVAVFCLTPGPNREMEVTDLAQAIRTVCGDGIPLHLVVLGRGTSEMKDKIEQALAGSGAEVSVLGILPAPEVTQILGGAEAQLFVAGPVSQRRGSALAGIACGLPVVGYAGCAAGTEIEEAGLALVPYRDAGALGIALSRVLKDTELHEELTRRSCNVQWRVFSWDAIADRCVRTLGREKPA